jgi:hypothetical protein
MSNSCLRLLEVSTPSLSNNLERRHWEYRYPRPSKCLTMRMTKRCFKCRRILEYKGNVVTILGRYRSLGDKRGTTFILKQLLEQGRIEKPPGEMRRPRYNSSHQDEVMKTIAMHNARIFRSHSFYIRIWNAFRQLDKIHKNSKERLVIFLSKTLSATERNNWAAEFKLRVLVGAFENTALLVRWLPCLRTMLPSCSM